MSSFFFIQKFESIMQAKESYLSLLSSSLIPISVTDLLLFPFLFPTMPPPSDLSHRPPSTVFYCHQSPFLSHQLLWATSWKPADHICQAIQSYPLSFLSSTPIHQLPPALELTACYGEEGYASHGGTPSFPPSCGPSQHPPSRSSSSQTPLVSSQYLKTSST